MQSRNTLATKHVTSGAQAAQTTFTVVFRIGPLVSELWKPKRIFISENGCSADDVMSPDGKVYDADRVMYLRNCLTHMQRAVREGYPLDGYFVWSLMDNFEWEDGYNTRFGIHHVDFKTQKRTPKLSADWYRELIRTGKLV